MGIWSRKPISELTAEAAPERDRFRQVLGVWDVILLGIGCIIGAGLFSLTGVAAAENAGPAITISFVIAAIGCVFAGLCYCEFASMIPVAGSAYTYAYATMGELAAWIMGWTLILEYAIGAATVAISWSAYIVSALHDLNIYLPYQFIASPWQPVRLPDGSSVYGWINLPAVLIVMAISLVLMRGIKESSFINNIIVVIKVAAILVFTGLGFFYINPENYHPFIPPNQGTFGEFGWSGIFQAAGVLFFAYIGFDTVSTAVQETKNPQRNIPIGILGSLLICTVLYILFGWVLVGLVNYQDLKVAAPVAVASAKIPIWWISWMLKIAVLLGLTSVILVLLLGQSRIFYAMSRDRLLPVWFSKIHPRYKTPWRASLVLMTFIIFLGAFAPISAVGHMTSIGTLFAFIIVCVGILILRFTHPLLPRPFRAPFFPWVPILGIIVCCIMMFSLDDAAWSRFIIWIIIGLFIYFLRR